MRHDAELDAELDALGCLVGAAVDLLGQLRGAPAPAEHAALRAQFAARVDGLRSDIERRYGLTDRQAVAVVARALARVGEMRPVTTIRD
jgi:hypothetical protein